MAASFPREAFLVFQGHRLPHPTVPSLLPGRLLSNALTSADPVQCSTWQRKVLLKIRLKQETEKDLLNFPIYIKQEK